MEIIGLLTALMPEQMLDGERRSSRTWLANEEPYAFHPHSCMFQLLTSVLLLGL